MADDIGYECYSSYGSTTYQTPRIDQLGAEGLRFTQAYAQPLCTPSRVKIMTGKSNFRNYITFGEFPFNDRTNAQVLKAVGYDTCIVGKWQLKGQGAQGPYKAGFDEYNLWNMLDVTENMGSRFRSPTIIRNAEVLTGLEGLYGPDIHRDYALDFIDRHKDEGSNPFFLYYPMALVHSPFEPTPDSPEWGQDIKENRFFIDMVEYHDKIIGQLVDKLDETGLRENTLIIYTGDNGTHKSLSSQVTGGEIIQGGKGLNTDAGTRVAMVANWKGKGKPGQVTDDIVDLGDILATTAEAASAPLFEDVTYDSVSFLPQILGEPGNPREWIFIYYRRNTNSVTYRFARDQRWKLYDTGELFDVPADVLEENHVPAGDPEADAGRTKLQAVLDQMQ
jgi:arylsulfatase A